MTAVFATATVVKPALIGTPAVMLRTSRWSARHLAGPARWAARSSLGRRIAFGLFFGQPARHDPRELIADLEAFGAACGFDATLPEIHRHHPRR
jgi:hypothetical protein